MARQWSATNDENFNRERLLCRAGGAPGWRLQFRTWSAKPPPYDRMIRMIRMTRRAGAAPMPGEASMPGWLQVYNNKAACSCPSSLSKFGWGTWTRGKHVIKFVQVPCQSCCASSGYSHGGESIIFSSSGCLVIKKRSFQAAPPAWAHADNNKAASSCPSSLSKFGGGTWTSGFARGKHVIKFVQVPCPSSCPSSGSPNKLGQNLDNCRLPC